MCAVSSSLDLLRRRLATSSSVRNQYDDGGRPAPCFSAEIVLSLPNIVSNKVVGLQKDYISFTVILATRPEFGGTSSGSEPSGTAGE